MRLLTEPDMHFVEISNEDLFEKIGIQTFESSDRDKRNESSQKYNNHQDLIPLVIS